MADFYNARGNTYFVATPDEIREFADLPRTAGEATRTRERWTVRAIERICRRPGVSEAIGSGSPPSAAKKYLSDGLLVGPFPDEHGFALLIVNTDGTLAERSGNGLTIFSQFLVDKGQANHSDAFLLRVYHGRPPSPFVEARVEAAVREGRKGFWIDMGIPRFGPSAVGAPPEYVGVSELEGQTVSRVFELEEIEPLWTCSQFVNVGNPHCVTFLKTPDLLPSMEQLGSEEWLPRLSAVANSPESDGIRGAGRPCKNGINLQWASVIGPNAIAARVFERGEGPTLSSGSSATAVASAARKLGLVDAKTVDVKMPGGVAPIRFDEHNDVLERMMLFGEAERSNPQ
jgi:diaminopimelate epimerase